MELYINDTAIGITPQESDTIHHLLQAVTKELEEGLIIATMIVDGTYHSPEDSEILQQPVATINKVELTVATKIEICLSLLEDGKQFVIIGAQELKNGSLSKKAELINSFAWIMESLEALKGAVAFPPTDIPILKAILREILKHLDQNLSIEETKELGNQLSQVIHLFDVLKEKLINEQQFSKENVLGQLQEILPMLSEIATNFQTGKDLHAIESLCKIIDNIEMFTRLAASLPDDEIMQQQAINLKDLSLQLLHGFENKDFVLIADLIEYDLFEQLEEILEN